MRHCKEKIVGFTLVILMMYGTSVIGEPPKVQKSDINGFKYIHVILPKYKMKYGREEVDVNGIGAYAKELFRGKGLTVIQNQSEIDSMRGKLEEGRLLTCEISHPAAKQRILGYSATVTLTLKDFLGREIGQFSAKKGGMDNQGAFKAATKEAFEQFAGKYNGFDEKVAIDPDKINPDWERVDQTKDGLKKYLDANREKLDPVEGIWTTNDNNYQIGIFRDEKSNKRDFVGIIIKSENIWWRPKQVKMELERTAYENTYTMAYFMGDRSKQNTRATINSRGVLEFQLTNPPNGQKFSSQLLKNYPRNVAEAVRLRQEVRQIKQQSKDKQWKAQNKEQSLQSTIDSLKRELSRTKSENEKLTMETSRLRKELQGAKSEVNELSRMNQDLNSNSKSMKTVSKESLKSKSSVPPPVVKKPPSNAIEARKLVSEYEENEVAADEKYKGKSVIVTGIVMTIGKDMLNNMYISLGAGGQFEVRQVQCFFDNKYENELAAVKKHSRITVKGKCDGLMMNVLLKDCVFVK